MLYDDESSKALDGKMEELVQRARDFVANDMPILSEQVSKIGPELEYLASKPDRTPAEDELLQSLIEAIQLHIQTIQDMKAIMGASITTRSIALYEHYKKLAEEGNEKAKEIYEELRPYYLAMLQEKLDSNLQ
jgi:hypothetical protein